MKTIYAIIVVFVLFSISINTFSQPSGVPDPKLNYRTISVNSPEMGSLWKYTSQAPDVSNGLPAQNINLFKLEESGISYSTDLYYNYSGFQVREKSTMVGLGWGITEGSIIRVVKHVPDYSSSLIKKYADFEDMPLPEYHPGIVSGVEDPSNVSPEEGFNLTENRLFYNLYDGQPDLYIYNFNGYSGKFIVKKDEVIKLDYNDLNISNPGGEGGIIVIRTPDGLLYTFTAFDTYANANDAVYAQTCNGRMLTAGAQTATIAWKLTKITNPNTNGEFNLYYKKYTGGEQDAYDRTKTLSIYMTKPTAGHPYYQYDTWAENDIFNLIIREYSTLERIETRTMQVKFSTNQYCDSITGIDVYDKTSLSTPIKTIRFRYGWFGDPKYKPGGYDSHDRKTWWLKLKEVVIKGEGVDEKYQFEYVDENYKSDDLHTDSKSIDHWGYYNGSGNEYLFPEQIRNTMNALAGQTVYFSKFAGSREPNLEFAKKFALEKVIFPTKGYVKNEYESAGGKGIRVKHLEINDGQTSIHKYYNYGNERHGAYYGFKESESIIWALSYPDIRPDVKTITFSPFPENMLDPYDEDMIYYPAVTECIGSPTGSGGKTLYIYGRPGGLQVKPLLVEKHDYSANDMLLKSEKYTYSNVTVRQLGYWHIPELRITGKPYLSYCWRCDPYPGFGQSYILGIFESKGRSILSSHWVKLDKIETIVDNVSTVKEFVYREINPTTQVPLDCNVITVKTTNSNGDSFSNKFFYAEDMSEPMYQPLKGLLKNTVVKTQNYSSSALLETRQLNYAKFASNAILQPSSLVRTDASGRNIEELSFLDYDPYGNLLAFCDISKLNTVYIWGYNHRYLIAEIKNATYEQLTKIIDTSSLNKLAAKENLSTEDIILINSLRKHLPESHIYTYTYKPMLGIHTATKPDGTTLFYEYNSLGFLTEIYQMENGSKKVLESYKYNYQNQ